MWLSRSRSLNRLIGMILGLNLVRLEPVINVGVKSYLRYASLATLLVYFSILLYEKLFAGRTEEI